MKKIFIPLALVATCLMTVVSCSEEEVDTVQYAENAVALNVYGPQPVVRGGVLRFLGSNLDQVAQVIIPGVDPITEIEVVQAGVPSEIRVTVPKDGPEPGLVTLVTADGQEIVTKTELTYSEPIEFEGFSPASAKAGDVITITGDYLNLIHEVIFFDNVIVSEEDFVEHSRYEIQVRVPAAAATGEIGLGDADELANPDVMANIVTSEEVLTVSQPAVSEISPLNVRPGDEVTITGTQMDQIVSVQFTGSALPVPSEEFVQVDDTRIVVKVPDDAHDGQVTCISAAGTESTTEASIVIDVPVVSGIAPETAYKAGLNVVISGEDLDMVTGVTFADNVAAEFSYADGQLKAVIPAEAVDGALSLATAAGKYVTTEAITLVRPVITAVSPAEINAGDSFTVTGTDLDLVTGVALNGTECTFELSGTTALTVSTTATSTSGKVTLTLANGTTVESGTELTVVALTVINVTGITETVTAGENVTMTGSNFNMIESIYIGETKVTSYVSRSDTEIVFVLPAEVEGGEYYPRFVLTTGEEENCLMPLTVAGAVTVITLWEGSWDCGSWQGNQDLAWGGYDWASLDITGKEAYLVFELVLDSSQGWWQVALRHGQDWADLPENSFYELAAGQTVLEVPFTQLMLDDLVANGGLVLTGCNYTLTRLTLELR